ncbi:MAG: T9SS type A sorting domain-containing protein [Candidatus Latescibacterota bacterium]|nr:MAG: T9SS type A sorting domain-containing protein [Candidatus Latescibacterota bacterium]
MAVREVSFGLRNGVAIYGGFAGTETALEERDIEANPTILSGEIGVPGPDDNTYHVVRGGVADSTAVIDGFIVTGGNADATSDYLGGGGILVTGGNPTVVNITFEDNLGIVGGGMYLTDGSAPTLIGVTFVNNSSTGGISMGGAARIDRSTPTFRNVLFTGNTARLGGGIWMGDESDVTLVNCVFFGNVAADEGGTEGWGGGVYSSNSTITMTNVTFVDNWADVDGGGLYNAEFGKPANVVMVNSLFWGNSVGGTGRGQIRNVGTAVTTISYSLIEGSGGSGPDWDGLMGVDAGNNIDADPFFVDQAGGNLRLFFGSPAMEAGDNNAPDLPATDMDGKNRIIGTHVDVGAYETTPVCPPANVFYVDQNASGLGNGSSWVDAFPRLVLALRAVGLCPGVDEIWVASGTYVPALSNNREETYRLQSGMALFGGFDGTESSPNERVLSANPTVLSGEIKDPGEADNCYHVVTSDGTDSTAVLDGFIVVAGNAVDASIPHGGGLINISGGPTVRNVTFSANSGTFGGGLYSDGGKPFLTDVIFTGNNATMGGGAALANTVDARLSNVLFDGNTASFGGGMYVQAGSVDLVNAVFAENLAINNGGGLYNVVTDGVTITNATFYANTAVNGGGVANNASDPLVVNTILWGNLGIEIYNFSGSMPIVSFSLVEDSGGSGAGWDTSLGVDGGHNIDDSPLFIDAPGGNLRLSSLSPAIDVGDNMAPNLPATDHEGKPRILRDVVDMGAYEDDTGTGIDAPFVPALTDRPRIRSVYPNPFNPVVTIEFDLDRERYVRAEVYDVGGRLVRKLAGEVRQAGPHRISWDARDKTGRRLASGVYILRVQSEGWSEHRKTVLLK